MKTDLQKTIADTLTRLLETEGDDWAKPWVAAGFRARNAATGKPYRGVNVFLLGMAGFTSPYWATYAKWKALGYQVASRDKVGPGTHIVLWKPVRSTDKDTGEERTYRLFRSYVVHNAEQLTTEFDAPAEQPLPDGVTPSTIADQLIADTGAHIVHVEGDRACYSPALDVINLPTPQQFHSTSGYYGTAFHELGHWSGHPSRLDRKLANGFGSPEYAFEELVAEITSAFLCGHTGIDTTPRPDHAHYINNWLAGLRDDPTAASRAFALAQRAADYLTGTTFDTPTEETAQ